MKRKGFTLIELLAVIIILAVIAIITTPIVLNVIKSSKEKANLNSAYGLIDGAKLYYSDSFLDDTKEEKIKNGENIWNDVAIQGNKPKEGKLYLNENGGIALSVIYDNVCYLKNFTEELQVLKNETCELSYTGTDQIPPTITIDPLEVVITIGDDYDLLTGVTAIDSDSGVSKITVKIGENEITSTKDLTFGTYTLIYEVTDKAGNNTRTTRELTVGDKNALTYILNHETLVTEAKTGLQKQFDHFQHVIYRYKSNEYENPKNYIKIDNVMYRIISISEEGSLKVMTDQIIYNQPFNASKCTVGGTSDKCPIWGKVDGTYLYTFGGSGTTYTNMATVPNDSDIKIYLNNTYYNSLSNNFKNAIEMSNWYFGAYDLYRPYDFDQIYQFHDESKIGMITLEEWVEASINSVCNPVNGDTCTNWTQPRGFKYLMTLNSHMHAGYAFPHLMGVSHVISCLDTNANSVGGIKPVMNLKANIRITSGTGTSADPYIIDF